MKAYKNYKQTETGINETKSFFSRMKQIFKFRKRKPKINSDSILERSNTDDTNNCSKSHNSSQRSINSRASKSSNNSIDLIREEHNNYEVVLPYQRFLKK
tara:strand:+ start:80 stop:379 length:300 start_codon:yes stop_codon:yes gene_type:complete